jgi:hypothetical protein
MRQLDVGDDQIGSEVARRTKRLAPVGHRFRLVAMGGEQVAEQLDVERVVLDNQDLGHVLPVSLPQPYAMTPAPPTDCETLALAALAATLTDERRAARFLDLTGLSPDGIRARLSDRRLLAACLAFLEAHEPDLVDVAAAIGARPEALLVARAELEL